MLNLTQLLIELWHCRILSIQNDTRDRHGFLSRNKDILCRLGCLEEGLRHGPRVDCVHMLNERIRHSSLLLRCHRAYLTQRIHLLRRVVNWGWSRKVRHRKIWVAWWRNWWLVPYLVLLGWCLKNEVCGLRKLIVGCRVPVENRFHTLTDLIWSVVELLRHLLLKGVLSYTLQRALVKLLLLCVASRGCWMHLSTQ